MDKLTTSELNRLITQETRKKGNTKSIGHVLPFIFKSFNAKLPAVDTLEKSDTEPLYDSATKTWRMPPATGQTIESSFLLFLNNLNKVLAKRLPGHIPPPLWFGSHTTRPVGTSDINRKPDLVLSDEVELQWNNMLVVAELSSTMYSSADCAGKTLDVKAWLVFRDQPWRRFVLFLSFCNEYRKLRVHLYDHSGGIVTPPVDIHREPDTFQYIMACIVFGRRDCIGFDLTITMNPKMIPPVSGVLWARNIKNIPKRKRKAVVDDHSEPHVQLVLLSVDPCIAPFHSHPVYLPPYTTENNSTPPSFPIELTAEPVAASRQPKFATHPSDSGDNDEVIGKVTVNDHEYLLLKVLFSCQGLVGRGTVCYLARRNGEEYIVKDHWVKGNKDAILNEVKMLEEMKGVVGVPELVEYWLVEVEKGQPDEMQNYCQTIHNSTVGMSRTHVRLVLKPRAHPLHMFRSKKELVKILRDIVLIQQCAVEMHQILHRDCSLNNIMIEDCEGGSRGALIDWEFASRIASNNVYPANGMSQTGTLEHEEAAHTTLTEVEGVGHFYRDDLESLFYVFTWVCSTDWLPEEWQGSQLDAARCAKDKSYFFSEHPQKLRLSEQFDPYFKDLVPLAEEWYDLLRKERSDRKDAEFHNTRTEELRFDEVATLLETHLARLSDDEKGPQFVVSRLELHESLDKLNESFKELVDKLVPPKRVREDDIEDVVPPKRCKVQ
ncbi:hypothetical protein EDD22DRAFT_958427 [Suillus occidentalis]|nr:hypothetical protein EDD22DRAFT_958427 [Suillus occidentalis]